MMETTIPTVLPEKKNNSTKRERVAWYMYDFGNSAYAAVVLLAVYSAYFKDQVVGGAEGSRLWGFSLGIAMLVVACISPILGAVADFSGSKKRFLLFFTSLACVSTALLFFVGPGDIFTGMLFFILAEIGYRSAQVFYNSLLPEIATEDDIGRISGLGWAIGSLGGILCLVIILALIMLIGGEFIVRLSFLITAIFYSASSLPIFLWLKEKAKAKQPEQGKSYLKIGFERVLETFRAVRKFREFIKFMIAFLIYNDGIIMALNFAAILGAVLYGMDQQQLIFLMISVQVTSVIGAYLFGHLADRIGPKTSLVISLLAMIAAVTGMIFNQTLIGYFIIASFAGFALTGVQSVSRTTIGLFSPPGQSAEFYGFFAVAGRTSSFIGPTIYGILAAEAAQWYVNSGMDTFAAEQSGQRTAILSILVFLVIGFIGLMAVNVRKAKEDALQNSL
ncbi:MAG: MFS transporter [Anaerolineales bacterium]|nr:MFS transporter [Anaerolineales bacterium]